MTYERSQRVVLAQQPGLGGPVPHFGVESSNSSVRMDALMPDWRDHAVGANLWWYADDWINRREHHLEEILVETDCDVVVALGTFTHSALGMDKEIGSLEKGKKADVILIHMRGVD